MGYIINNGIPYGGSGLIETDLIQNEVKTSDTFMGKPIYTKTIMFNTTVRDTIFEYEHNITDAEYIWIDMQNSFMLAQSGLTYPLCFYRYNGSNNSKVQVSATKTHVRLDVVDGWDEIWTKVITVRYTKTTD